MRRLLLFFSMLVCVALSAMAESVITITTSKAYGDTFVFYPMPQAEGTISVDWGAGNKVDYQLSPTMMTYELRREGALKGNTVKIYGELAELSINEQSVTGVKLEGQTNLKSLDLNKNALTFATLDLGDAQNLKRLSLAENKIHILNLRDFSKLEFFDIYGNPELSTVAFADNNPELKVITMYDCDIVHFYDTYNFPKLTSVDLHNNSLMDISFPAEKYPSLTSINVSGNSITELDVSGLAKLEDLAVAKNQLTELNVAANPELKTLSIANNEISKLNLANNNKLTSLNVSNTKLTKLDVSKMAGLRTLMCDSLRINRLEIGGLKWLQTLSAKACDLEFLDFTANYFTLRYLYLQGNKSFTPQSLNFMYQTMQDPGRQGYIYVKDSNGETANAEKYLMHNEVDSHWKIDVMGDGSCSMDDVVITQQATTGGTYKVMKRNMEYSSDKDAFARYYDEVGSDGKVVPGSILCVRYTAEEGKEYKGIMVNGTLVQDTLFTVTANADVKAIFEGQEDESCITLTVPAGQQSTYAIGADNDDTPVTIDWGDGKLKKYTAKKTWTTINGTTEGTKVKIYGDVTYLNCESYPGYAADNKISAIDLTKNNKMKYIDMYFNELKTIDVTNQPDLLYLDVSMNKDIKNVDVTKCPLIEQLSAYGLDELSNIDVKKNPELQLINLKNTKVGNVDLTNNAKLIQLNLTGCGVTEINVSHMADLKQLYLSSNEIKNIDLKNNTKLLDLSVLKNKLTSLDLSKNVLLEKLDAAENTLDGLDLSANKSVWYIDVRGNKWNACQLNDFYYSLPQYVDPGPDVSGSTTPTKLWIASGANENDVEHSETLIAKAKLWVMNITENGDGTGCNEAYITILPYENGEVTVKDAGNNVVKSGSKVQKNTEITVNAIPANGYTVLSMKANGQDIADNKFVVKQATEVAVKFSLVSSIGGVERVVATTEGGNHVINIYTNSEVKATVLGANGKVLFSDTLSADTSIGFPTGIYIVTLQNGTDTITRKLLVK